MIHVSPTLSPITYLKALFSSEKNYLNNIQQFSYVRGALICAIISIIKEKNLKETPTVWAPSFVCDTVFFLLEAYDIPYKFYPVTEDLLPDWSTLESMDTSENDIFMLVYFFGFPMGIEESKEFCKKRKLFLIEDCAHSIVDKIKENGIGTHGDAAIFGLRKALPLPHGGFLYMKDLPFHAPKKQSDLPGIYRSPLKMMIQWVFHKLKVPWDRGNQPIKKNFVHTFPENYGNFNFLEEMAPIAKKLTNAENIGSIVTKRQSNYQTYYDALANHPEVTVPNSLKIHDDQTTPWIFFFFHKNAEGLINALRADKIPASDFPTLHHKVFNNKDYDIDNQMYYQSVSLPVHQDISKTDLNRIISRVKYHLESL